MMELTVLFLSCWIALVQAVSWETFASKYATVKIFSSCLGEDAMIQWHKNYSEAVNFCRNQNPEVYLENLPLDDDLFHPLDPQEFSNLQSDDFADNYQPELHNPFGNGQLVAPTGILDLNVLLSALQGNLTNPILLVPLPYLQAGLAQQRTADEENYYRKKRQVTGGPIYDQQKISAIYNKIQQKAGNFTCVVKRLEIFNEDFDVNINYLMERVKELNLNDALTNDIFEAMTDCIRFAACRPLNRINLMPPAIQRAMTYLKCETKQKLAACVKDDVKKMQSQFDLEALKNIKAGSEVDDEDKMLAIMWGDFKKE